MSRKTETAEQAAAARTLCRTRLMPYVLRFTPRYKPGWMHLDICERLEKFSAAVANEESPRLMLLCPPRHGKSELSSRKWPAWHLGRYGWHEFIQTSYSGSLAMGFSRSVRGQLRDPEYGEIFPTRLSRDTQSAELWRTESEGQYLAAGVGGPLTGNGAHVLDIDDPVKNKEEAESAGVKLAMMEWYGSTAYTRLSPGGGVLLTMTRWAHDDLAGQLLQAMKDATGSYELADQWEVVKYAAIAPADERYRRKGEALHPERYPIERLNQIKAVLGPRDFTALYQQEPRTEESAYFQEAAFVYYKRDERPPLSELAIYQAWDFAVTKERRSNHSVCITVGVDKDSGIWVLDLARGRWGAAEIAENIVTFAVLWSPNLIGVEDGVIWQAMLPHVQQLIQEKKAWHKVPLHMLKVGRRDKVLRARPIQAKVQQRMVRFPMLEEAPFMKQFLKELLEFPDASEDDCVDVFAWIGQMLISMTPFRPDVPPAKKSWKDKLRKYVDGRSSSIPSMAQ